MIEVKAIESVQNDYLASKSPELRKEMGQYFTGSAVADYMASMISPVKTDTVRILDAGAGAGILTHSAALRCLNLGNNRIHAVLYEIDGGALKHLDRNMMHLTENIKNLGGTFTYDIRNEDFILARPDRTEAGFDVSSINPPYFKYSSKSSTYAGVTADLYKGDPNIYASFVAVTVACMGLDGQLVAIIPRSFTNGLYFKGFRLYLNRTMSLDRIHIFRARNRVFRSLDVLQENIIGKYTRCAQKSRIAVCTSSGHEDLNKTKTRSYPAGLLIDRSNEHEIIRIPESSRDADILKHVELWPGSFQENGYAISTGTVVSHRAREFIVDPDYKGDSVPLLSMHNIKVNSVQWQGDHKKDARFRLTHGHEKHVIQNGIYVLLKRFSAKDDRRRLVAGVSIPGGRFDGTWLALENHLNYVGRQDDGLEHTEAFGLATLFNSTFMDQYFRCISGNTQVNATEIRLIRLPDRETVWQIGESFLKHSRCDQQDIDEIVNGFIRVPELAIA